MPFRTYATVLVLAATAITGACGSDDSAESGATSTTTTTVTSEDVATSDEATTTLAPQASDESTTTSSDEMTTTSAASATVPNACDVLTAEEFTAVMGSPSTSAAINEGEPACEFTVTGKGIVVRLSVVGGMSADAIVSQVNPSEFQEVSGIGEKMYVSSEGRQAVMKSGDLGYQLTRWEGTVTAAQLTELMRSIVAG